MNLNKAIFLFIFLFLYFPTGWSQSDIFDYSQFSQIKLVSPQKSISHQTKKISIGLWITLNKGWHSYWKYPGESGKPLKVKWHLPEGSTLSDLQWPIPKRFDIGSLTNFVYKDHVLLISELSLPPKKQNLKIAADVEWFICKEVCVPIHKKTKLNVNLQKEEKIKTFWKNTFDKWSKSIPKKIDRKSPLNIKDKNWQAHISTEKKLKLLDILPLSKNTFSPKKPKILSTNSYHHSFVIQPQNKPSVSHTKDIKALAIFENKESKLGYIYTFTSKTKNIFWFLLLALLGGVLLNLMPCVLPIVFLKFTNILEQSKQKTAHVILSNLAYTAGVISSFIVLALFVVLLKKGGQSIGWGFQMQSPYFLLSIIFLFTLISFNFIGWFSLSLPSIPFFHRGKNLFKHFLTGILSTTAASPCTVPFMGASIGYAFANSTFHIIMIFLFLGIGLSFPYLLLSIFPKGINYIPTPGNWGHKLKHFMAFPMLATSVWLIHLFNQLQNQKLFILLSCLLLLTFGFWLLNNFKRKQWLTWISRFIIFVSLIFPFLSLSRSTIKTSIPWEVFSKEKMEHILSEEKPLFVNFTADWCLTCKFNEEFTFKNKKVIQFFTDKNIQSLKGDWSNKNPEISHILEQYNRSGIPFYLYFPPGSSHSSAVILPELLTPNTLLKYLNRK